MLQKAVNIVTSVFSRLNGKYLLSVRNKYYIFFRICNFFLVISWLQHSLMFTVLNWHYDAKFFQLDQPLIQWSTTLILYSVRTSLFDTCHRATNCCLQSKVKTPVRAVLNQLLNNEDSRRIRAVAARIHSIDTRWRWIVRFTLRSLYHGVLRLEGGMARSFGLEVVESKNSIFPTRNRRQTENTIN